jgi:hypothetical protein
LYGAAVAVGVVFLVKLALVLGFILLELLCEWNVDDCSYVRHSPAHKPEREPLRGVYGSYLRQSWNIEMASSLQRVEKNSR